MHWLPLVAMVIASALSFPHNPASRIAAATPEPGFDNRRDRHDPPARLTAPPVDYNFHENASQTDYNMAAALSQHTNRQNLQNHKDYVKSSADEETSTFKVENQRPYQSNSNSGNDDKSSVSLDVPTERRTLRTEDISKDNFLPKDYKADSSSRQDYSSFVDFSKKENLQDSTDGLLQVSNAEAHNAVSPVANLKGQRRPEPTDSPEKLGDAPTIETGSLWTPGAGRGPAEESLNLDAALGLGTRLDSILEGDEMFLDAHPRVLFSPSPSPPEHPPLLLMLETGLLEEDRDREEQEDMDGHIEGHGDRAIDRSTTLSWADSSRVTIEAARPLKRDKRSHLIDRRRGEKSVCEMESVWVTDKTTAIDSYGRNVTILQEIQTQTGPLKQYFYETRCRQPEQRSSTSRSKGASAVVKSSETGVAGAGCLGVDKKQWVSQCKSKQSYVRALTKDANNRTGWRWIRIDSSCVCVLLSRTSQAVGKEVLTGKGKG
ncbi:uncharacterized protein LOC119894049 [Micropterus salmoides]|uniref:uncharacterized protein LOC119894049 n=1 Tax=Micropterus salmoides TaxID=27706 RepID=UPI0018EC8E5E|nr:uncharacterized protein LOC119894049 [Micropterus salmoides]XP_038562482.1 uncharacterized protein LOC119894049 [Micropterus salmoides]XP_038562488.1 uncharacterized protein LOC119894049 [Micropterus salmoides]